MQLPVDEASLARSKISTDAACVARPSTPFGATVDAAAAEAAAMRRKNRLARRRCSIHEQLRGKATGDYSAFPSEFATESVRMSPT